MYPGVPSTAPASVVPGSVTFSALSCSTASTADNFAMPQSSRYTSPKSPSITFPGFTSRCTTPRACAKSMVCANDCITDNNRCRVYRAHVAASSSCSRRITSASVTPRTRFIVKYGRASRTPSSCTGTTPGCSSCPCTRASRTKRARAVSSCAVTVLNASSRPRC